jgi:D-glycero-D-manno-heptose 1,7-bisphosphate phosphatase
MASLNAVHLRLNQLLAEKGGRLDAAFFCPHAPEENCNCRKPLPGLVEQIGERFGVDLSQVHMVGASVRDLQTARNAGCVPHLVRGDRLGGVDEAQLQEQIALVPGSRVHQDLAAFAETLIHEERRARAQSRGESAEPDTSPGDLS